MTPAAQETRSETGEPVNAHSLGSVPIRASGATWRRALAFLGPGFVVSVGYMDPGNWATDLAGGSRYGYTLLFVIMLSNLLAILLQTLALRLGIATGRDLAQACRDTYSRPVTLVLWLLAELAIIACDLAEVLGSAIALNLLFHLPLAWGVVLTGADVLLLLLLQNRGFRQLEALVITLIVTISGLFAFEVFLSRPAWGAIAFNLFVPHARLVTDPAMLYIAVSILGATVMPHNLYLHSAIVQTRAYPRTVEGRREAVRFATFDSVLALSFALLVNAGILVVAAAVFHTGGHPEVAEIGQAYRLLSPMLGVGAASTLFAVALLASGQNSTLTGTLAGQIVMEGFLNIRLRPWVRRLITRLLALVPALVVVLLFGEHGTSSLLLFSQVVLSMQLSFAVFPLVHFTSQRTRMGRLVSGPWLRNISYASAILIAVLNLWLIFAVL